MEELKQYDKCGDDGFGIPFCAGLNETDINVADLYSGLSTIYTVNAMGYAGHSQVVLHREGQHCESGNFLQASDYGSVDRRNSARSTIN